MLHRIFSSRLMRFGAVGGAVTVFFMGLNALLGRVLGLAPNVAFLAAYPPALCLHFTLNKLWTFRDSRTTSGRHLAEYIYSSVVTFLIQWPCFLLLHGALGMPGWAAAGGANLLQMAVSYAFLRWRVFRHTVDEPADADSRAWYRLGILAMVIGASALIAWTAFGKWELPQFGGSQGDYYNMLVSGFRKGSLAMDVVVPESLIRAENPWDPTKRPPGTILHDASYYNGHFYLYFGVVPAVMLFWPFRVLMGFDLPFAIALPVYLVLAYLVTAWLWLRILRDRFPRASMLTKTLGPLLLGLAAGQLVLARRNSIWEMPIGAGYFFMVCMIVSAYLALRARRPWGWLGLAGLSLGLGVGCRPTLAAAGIGLAWLVIAIGWSTPGAGLWGRLKRSIGAALAAGVPLALVMAGLLAYNWARFGKVLEFGLNYQVNAAYVAKARYLQLAFAPFNLAEYFVRSPQWGRYFPFVHPVASGVQPREYYGVEYVYGVLVVCPVIWFALLAAGFLRGRGATAERPFAGVVLAMALASTAMLACFNSAAARYVPDFLPWWMWLGLLGWAWLEDQAASWRGGLPVNVLRLVFGACAAMSLLLAFVQSCVLHGVLKFANPDAYYSIARVFNTPAALWERARGERLGKITMDVRFPDKNSGTFEPLLVTGVEYEADYFSVFYRANRVIQLGFESSSDSLLLSEELQVDPSKVYHLGFSGGSIFPPAGHPTYAGWTPAEVHSAVNWIQIEFNGRPVIFQEREAHESAPELFQFGRDVRSGAFGKRFSGSILKVRREALPPRHQPTINQGDIILDVTLPREIVPGSQPLVVAGRPGLAEIVGYRTIDEQHFALTYEFWGSGIWESGPVAVPPDRNATLSIRLGSILPSSNRFQYQDVKDDVVVWMNGSPIWWRRSTAPIDPNPTVEIMANFIGSSAQRNSFDGNLKFWTREPAPVWKSGPFKAVEMDIAGRGAGNEPLLATGKNGYADTLAISWLPDNRARLIYDHWGWGLHSSGDFDWDPARMHHLRIELPSLAVLDVPDTKGALTGRLQAEIDGTVVWDSKVPYYPAASGTFSFGRNQAGSSVSSERLSLFIADVRQAP